MTQSKWIFLAVLITSFIGPFMGSSINIAIPSMAKEFQLPVEQLSWVVTAYLLGSASALLPFGKLADIIGRKRLYRIGIVAIIITTIGSGLAPSMDVLVLFRLLQGVSLAMIFSTGMAILVSSHKPEERGKVIGYSSAAVYIGLSLGPVIGGMITQYFGWRLIFFLTAAGLVLSFAAVSKVSDEWYGDKQEKLDYFGSLLYCAASSMVLYGLSAYAEHPMVKYIFFGGVVLFGIFLLEQSRVSNPLLEMGLFHNTIFTMSNLAAMIHYSSTFALGFLLSLYLQLIRGFDASTAGLFLLLQPSMMALFSPKAGALSDRLQPRFVATSGMAMTAIGLAAFSFLTAVSPIWQIAVNLLFIGIGFAFFSSPNSNAIMGAVEPRQYGVAASVLSVMRLGGQAISMAIVTVLLSVYTVDAMSPEYLPSLLAAFHKIFEVLAVSCVLGVAASLARGKRKI